ncbi:hypothetical protein K3175_00885 [Qipengyuania sp. GH1]|uniref:hypothetical protein n=1 Tax=Qipengyuania aestuarii TaxID=2867241 RepID=UPI001C87400A|nr:hypothetical protein [Qipengyuania aestuarii]MBX7534206.1 hypothetical protein [Qipengyuania aestuarii]
MIDRKTQMLADKHLRDSARALVDADIEHLKADLAHKGVGERILDRAKEGAIDLYEDAIDLADDNKGAFTALLAAVAVWFARHPILSAFGFDNARESEEDEEWDLHDGAAEH